MKTIFKILKVYEYYNGPVLSLERLDKQIFLSVLVDETSEYRQWLKTSISEKTLIEVEAGQIDLHSGFKPKEDQICYLVTEYNSEERLPSVKEISLDWLMQHLDYLPTPNFTLNGVYL